MASDFRHQLRAGFGRWWRDQAAAKGPFVAGSLLLAELWGFICESTPARRRQRYGDVDYDWEQRVDTTSATVDWRTRLLGVFHSPYQPTDPALFREIMAALPIDFHEFTFIDLGSGKGRTLLMASEYPFRKIVGVELIAELHRAAEENIARYRRAREESVPVESVPVECVLGDACEFEFPGGALVVYLFNPLPERALREVLLRLGRLLQRTPRTVWIVYHNPLLESTLLATGFLEKWCGTEVYSIYRTVTVTG